MKPQITHNREAEQYALGLSLLDDSGASFDEAVGRLAARDFGDSRHQAIFAAMREIHGAGEPLDQVTLCERLQQAERLHAAGGVAYIADLTTGLPLIDIGPKIDLVLWYSRRRRVGSWAQRLLNICLDPTTRPEDLDTAMEIPEAAIAGQTPIQPFGEVLADRAREIQEAAEKPGELPGWTTSLTDLDRSTTGIRPAEFWVIGAIPGSGKTALLGQMALANAERGVPVGIFSLEMASSALVDRLVSARSRLRLMKFRNPRSMSPEDLTTLTEYVRSMSGLPIYFDESAGISLVTLRARARLMVRRFGCRLLFVDFLQLVEADGDSRREKVSAVARGLKNLSKDLNVGVVVASQLARPQRGAPTAPTLLSLKESGDIEAAADTVLLIHRPYVLSHREEDHEREEIIIAKQRHGIIGNVPVVFDEAHTAFRDAVSESHWKGSGVAT